MDDPRKVLIQQLKAAKCWERIDRVGNDPEMTDFRRRARLNQARWRESKGYPMGRYRGRDLGSLLAEHPQDEGRNFLSDHIRAAVRHRLAHAQPGEQVDAQRLRTNMLSSMPLCFNLFGELWKRPVAATPALKAWVPGMPGEVDQLVFEWSPGRADPAYLGNRTAFDAAFLLNLPDGSRGIVGVETKYHEVPARERPPGSNRLPRYERVTEKSKAFVSDWRTRLVGTDLQQIWLDHLLLLSMLQHPEERWSWGRYVLVYPEQNTSFVRAADRYREALRDNDTFETRTLEQLLDAHVLPEHLEREFRRRYLW